MANVTIGNSVTSIGQYAFAQCGLINATIPNSVTSIGDYAFWNCPSLGSVTIGNSVTTIGFETFDTCLHLGSVTIGNSVSNIEAEAFWCCISLSNVIIPNSVTNIDYCAFGYCGSLTNITIPNSVISIGYQAFLNCTNLAGVTIGNNVTNIGYSAFYNSDLTNVTIPKSVIGIGSEAFADCTSLTAITVDALNSAYCSVDGVLFNKTQSTLIQWPGGRGGSYTITNRIANIGDYAFCYCSGLTNITVPSSVTNIGFVAFWNCPNLLSVYFQGNCPSVIAGTVFQNDNNAVVYYLPNMTGWGRSLGGCPTMLWNPQAQTGDGSFGVQNNCFGFNITGTSGIGVLVEACNLPMTNLTWVPLQTITFTGGLYYFSDPAWTNYPGRCYRLRSP